jgi:hypothetical protein
MAGLQGEDDGARVVPNANSPALLTHLLEMVSRGLRSPRTLSEALGIDQRTVRYYVQAGVWLGFLEDSPEPLLSPEGLAYVYGGKLRRARYAEAVSRQPFVLALVKRSGGARAVIGDREVRAAIAQADPSLSPATVERRASAVRGLLAPWLEELAHPHPTSDVGQLALPLAQTPHAAREAVLTRAAGRSFSPDVYAFLLAFLLDYGELTLGHVRGLLDGAGADDVPIGAYVDLAVERGDAVRLEDRLIVTAAAIGRKDVAGNPDAIVLTDGGWRAHIARWLSDPGAAAREPGRYRLWDQRLLGGPLRAETLERDLARVLRDRTLEAWPLAAAADAQVRSVRSPFLDVWQEPGLLLTVPPNLVHLWEGVAGVNRRLRAAKHRTDAVGAPTLALVPVVAHGGLFHPGEDLPASIPDTRTLRQHLLSRSPYPAMIAALLLAHRSEPGSVELRRERGDWWVRSRRRMIGPVLEVCDAFAVGRGWLASRRPTDMLTADALLGVLEKTGVIQRSSDQAVLDDALFLQLRSGEEVAMGAALEELGRAILERVEALAAASRAAG